MYQKLIAALLFVAVAIVQPHRAIAATLAYTFATVDIPLANGGKTYPEDINSAGTIIANAPFTQSGILATPAMVKRVRTYKATPFDCAAEADTAAFAVNDSATVVGYCVGSNGSGKVSGFIRARTGKTTLLDFPGADGTAVFGINDLGHAVGQFYGPLDQPNRGALAYRFHCFTWIAGRYRQIDFPRANTYVSCHAINNRGTVLGEYITVTDANEYVEHGWFTYSNGTFDTSFPLSYAHVGGDWIYLSDMNNDGAILGQRSDGTVFLYDDGIFYSVAFPVDFHYPEVRGLNDKGQFVGSYRKLLYVDPMYGNQYESHGFVATPAR